MADQLTFVSYEEELAKNPEITEADVDQLRAWMDTQPHLPKMTDAELVIFLSSCENDIEHAKETIDNYFTVRSHAPDIFTDRDVNSEHMQNSLKTMSFVILENAIDDEGTVVLFRFNDTNPSKHVFGDAVKNWTALSDIWTARHGSSHGYLLLFDMAGMQLGHITRINISQMSRFLYYLQMAMPIRLKGFHYCNVVPFFDKVMNIMRPFLKKDLSHKIVLHKTMDSVYQVVKREALPPELGGDNKPLAELAEETTTLMETYADWLKEHEVRAVVDESKRPEKGKSATEMFGTEETFKDLQID